MLLLCWKGYDLLFYTVTCTNYVTNCINYFFCRQVKINDNNERRFGVVMTPFSSSQRIKRINCQKKLSERIRLRLT